MKDKVKRTVKKIGGSVFMFTHKLEDKSTDDRLIELETTNKTQVTLEVLDEYELDRKLQYDNFKGQETTTIDKLKRLEKDYSKHCNERGFLQYKKNFQQYEIYEKFIENNTSVEKFLTGDSLKDFRKYEKGRDKYKNFFITMNVGVQIELLKQNIEAYQDIWEEDAMFRKQIVDARKLLK